MPQHGEKITVKLQGSNSMSTLLIRLLAGKVMEAIDRLNSRPLGPTLAEAYFDLVPNCNDKLRTINRNVSNSPWYRALRNGHTFHYPSAQEWKKVLGEGPLEGLAVYVGQVTGNSLCEGSDAIANMSAYGVVNRDDWLKGFDSLMHEVYDTAGLLGELLQQCVVLYAERHLISMNGKSDLPSFEAPALEGLHLPYFVAAGSS
jgi:hypothetical protein